MIHVRIELWPGGDQSRARTIGTVDLANVSGLAETSDYDVSIMLGGSRELGIAARDERFVVSGHRRKDGIASLLGRVFARSLPTPDEQRASMEQGS